MWYWIIGVVWAIFTAVMVESSVFSLAAFGALVAIATFMRAAKGK